MMSFCSFGGGSDDWGLAVGQMLIVRRKVFGLGF